MRQGTFSEQRDMERLLAERLRGPCTDSQSSTDVYSASAISSWSRVVGCSTSQNAYIRRSRLDSTPNDTITGEYVRHSGAGWQAVTRRARRARYRALAQASHVLRIGPIVRRGVEHGGGSRLQGLVYRLKIRCAFAERTALDWPSGSRAELANAPFVSCTWCGQSVPNITRSGPTTDTRYRKAPRS